MGGGQTWVWGGARTGPPTIYKILQKMERGEGVQKKKTRKAKRKEIEERRKEAETGNLPPPPRPEEGTPPNSCTRSGKG